MCRLAFSSRIDDGQAAHGWWDGGIRQEAAGTNGFIRVNQRSAARGCPPCIDQERMMKTVYFKSGDAEWKYELDDKEYDQIIHGILEDGTDFEEMLDESLEILRDVSSLDDDELDEDDQIDQTISVAFIWHYFNNLPEDQGRIEGDVVVIEDDDGTGVSVLSADEAIEP